MGFRERPNTMRRLLAQGGPGGSGEELSAEHVPRIREAFLPGLRTWYPRFAMQIDAIRGPA